MRGLASAALVCCLSLWCNFARAKRPDFIDDDMMDMMKSDKEECMAENGTTEDMIEKAGDGDIPNDRRLTCYMSCLLSRLGLLDDDGNIDADMLLSFAPDELQATAREVLDICGKPTGADTCEKMYNAAMCLYKECPSLWFMV